MNSKNETRDLFGTSSKSRSYGPPGKIWHRS